MLPTISTNHPSTTHYSGSDGTMAFVALVPLMAQIHQIH